MIKVNDRVKFKDVSDGDNMLGPRKLVGKVGRVVSIESPEFKPRITVIHFKSDGEVKTLDTNIRKV